MPIGHRRNAMPQQAQDGPRTLDFDALEGGFSTFSINQIDPTPIRNPDASIVEPTLTPIISEPSPLVSTSIQPSFTSAKFTTNAPMAPTPVLSSGAILTTLVTRTTENTSSSTDFPTTMEPEPIRMETRKITTPEIIGFSLVGVILAIMLAVAIFWAVKRYKRQAGQNLVERDFNLPTGYSAGSGSKVTVESSPRDRGHVFVIKDQQPDKKWRPLKLPMKVSTRN